MRQEAYERLAWHIEPGVRAAAAASLPRAAVTVASWDGGPQFLADRYKVRVRRDGLSVLRGGPLQRDGADSTLTGLLVHWQAFCEDADGSVLEAALADTVSVVAAAGSGLQSSLLGAAADAARRQSLHGGRPWRGRLALAEEAASLAALCTPEA